MRLPLKMQPARWLPVLLIGWVLPAEETEEAAARVSEAAAALQQAWREATPIPRVREAYGIDRLDLAYAVQAASAKIPAAGWRMALTDPLRRERMGASEPVFGRFGRDQVRMPGQHRLVNEPLLNPFIELELALILREGVTPEAEGPLSGWVKAVAPAIVVSELNFREPYRVMAEDLVAANLGTRWVMFGAERPLERVALDQVVVNLFREGTVLDRGKVSDLESTPEQAVRAMLRHRDRWGGPEDPGRILLIGRLTGMVPADTGDYVADFGALGPWPFTIQRRP